MKKIFFIITILHLVIINQLFAIKASPHPITITQPDQSKLVIYVGGDEHFKYHKTEDGILIKQDIDGYYKYATIENNQIIAKSVIAKNKADRSSYDVQYIKNINDSQLSIKLSTLHQQKIKRKALSIQKVSQTNEFPTKGTIRSLVILVNFSDKKFVTPSTQAAFNKLLNQEGYEQNGGTGSARDYFISSSLGQFTPQFDVVGPFTLPQTMEYYGKNNSSGDDENPQQMVIDACTKANAEGVNFAQYDYDNNGIVDNVFIYYAGHNEAEGADKNTVWPHRWSLNDTKTSFDGKIIFDYACTSELRSATGSTMCGIGTFCHEFGHVLGLVDYYHTSDDKNTLNDWSIMDAGAYLNQGRTPPLYSSYDRFALDWLLPTQLSSPTNIQLKPLQSSNRAFLISQYDTHNLDGSNPTPKEFFLIENRIKAGFDSYLPGSGMLIWHIDYDQTAWKNNSPNNYEGFQQTSESHMRVYLQPLVGNSVTPGSAFTSGTFQPQLWNGTVLDKTISNIAINNQDVSFIYRGGSSLFLPPFATAATNVTNHSLVANWDATLNAKNYLLTAYYFIEGNSKESENFDNGLQLPIGWKTTILSTVNIGTNNAALLSKFNGESITTEAYPEPIVKFDFKVETLDGNNGNLKVEAYNGESWETVDNLYIPGFTSETKTFSFNNTNNYTQFRVLNTGANASIALDDFEVTYSLKINYHYKNKVVANTSDTLTNLVPDQTYYYMVKAVDIDNKATLNSNKIYTKLLTYNEDKKLRVDLYVNGDVYVFPENLTDEILLFNLSGQIIAKIIPTDFKINIKDFLHKNSVYVLKSGNRIAKILY